MRNATRIALPCIGLSLLATVAQARTFTYQVPYVPPTTRFTSDVSLIAAMRMAAFGLLGSDPDPLDNILKNQCSTESAKVRGAPGVFAATHLQWYAPNPPFPGLPECNPLAIANVVRDRFPRAASYWAISTYSEGQGEDAVSFALQQISDPAVRSPVVVPLYGNWDHWATIYEMDTEEVVDSHPELGIAITAIRLFDGYPNSQMYDWGSHDHKVLSQEWVPTVDDDISGWAFHHKYYQALAHYTNAACCTRAYCTCDKSPYSDSWYKKYIAIFNEPPPYIRARSAPPIALRTLSVRPAPGLTAAGRMSAHIASSRVFSALHLAGRDRRPQVRQLMREGHADTAYLVQGRYNPSDRENYYMVPVRNNQNQLLAFVLLNGEDGAFQHLAMLPYPMVYEPVSAHAAQSQPATLAQLRPGERLGDGALVWEATSAERSVAAPYLPFYEFPILDAKGYRGEVLRVNFRNGSVLGRKEATGLSPASAHAVCSLP